MNELTEKLNRMQTKLIAPKGQLNNFGKYKYRSCEDILEALKPLLGEEKVILTIADNIRQIGDRYYVEATATISDGENSLAVTAFAREPENRKGMDDAQLTGATSSYARKYALNGLFCIDDTKDADSTNDHAQGSKPKENGFEEKAEAIISAINNSKSLEGLSVQFELYGGEVSRMPAGLQDKVKMNYRETKSRLEKDIPNNNAKEGK